MKVNIKNPCTGDRCRDFKRFLFLFALMSCHFPRFAVESAENFHQLGTERPVGSWSDEHCGDFDFLGVVRANGKTAALLKSGPSR